MHDVIAGRGLESVRVGAGVDRPGIMISGGLMSSLSRRELLGTAAAAGALSMVSPLSEALSPQQAMAAAAQLGVRYDPGPFTLGVASGDPLPSSVSLWTRLAPDPLARQQKRLPLIVEVVWAMAEDRQMRRVVARGTVWAHADQAHSVHVDVHDLKPGRTYYYQFQAMGRTSRLGRTRTAPTGNVKRVRFASANCQAFQDGYFAAFRDIAAQDLDFVVHLGDYIYEMGNDKTEKGKLDHRARKNKAHDFEPYTVADYRVRHALYKGDPSLRAAHAAHPWFLTWDNHEVEGQYDGTESGKKRFEDRRDAAYQAWWEHMPHRMVGDDMVPHQQIYRARHWGNLLDLMILDLRQYRTAPERKHSTILGARQNHWLLEEIRHARGAWECWANSIMLSRLGKKDGDYYYEMQWDGYPRERTSVLSQAHNLGLEDLVVISGDYHSAFVDDIHTDFDNHDSPVIGTEFLSRSISSRSGGAKWNKTNGPKMGTKNPHLQYFEGDRYGYDLYEVTAEKWATHMRMVANTRDPASPVSTLTSFHIKRGHPGAVEDPATISSPAQYRRRPGKGAQS